MLKTLAFASFVLLLIRLALDVATTMPSRF
jgi:hypothetical protein